MAIPVARVHLAMAHAALPALLPTLAKWNMLPLLLTPLLCVAILLVKSPPPNPKPSRADADADERWDARKNATKSPSDPGRADTNERWDAHKVQTSHGLDWKSSSPGRAPSCERWYTNKKNATTSSSSSSSGSSSASRASLGKKWGRPAAIASRASSAERWDAHKKPCLLQGGGSDDDDGQSSAGSNDMELDAPQRAFYSGPGFVASPEPSMLPMPSSLMVRVA